MSMSIVLIYTITSLDNSDKKPVMAIDIRNIAEVQKLF